MEETLMEGITILNTIEHEITGWGWSWLGFICGLVVIILMCGIYLMLTENESDFSTTLAIGFSLLLIILLIIAGCDFFSHGKIIGYYNTYEVTISKSVNFIEFDEQYQILDHHGSIYEIMERGSDQKT